jgi:hypothetical protein
MESVTVEQQCAETAGGSGAELPSSRKAAEVLAKKAETVVIPASVDEGPVGTLKVIYVDPTILVMGHDRMDARRRLLSTG